MNTFRMKFPIMAQTYGKDKEKGKITMVGQMSGKPQIQACFGDGDCAKGGKKASGEEDGGGAVGIQVALEKFQRRGGRRSLNSHSSRV